MSIPSFYYPLLASNDCVISLDANEASHAVKSRRLRVGQTVRIFNGAGRQAIGILSLIERRSVRVELSSIEQLEQPARKVSIAVAVPKGDRQKVMVDMLTQLGVFEIIPLRCQYSVTKFSPAIAEKWARVAVEACKQSQNPWLPIITSERDLDDLLSSREDASSAGGQVNLLVANADGDCSLSVAPDNADVTVIIGPEGGFSDQEFAKLKQFSVPSMGIGPYILRTEAAAIAAASALIA